ncbi:MAG: hypothetical protein ACOYKZ_00265 [Chlamydiia bacterium]
MAYLKRSTQTAQPTHAEGPDATCPPTFGTTTTDRLYYGTMKTAFDAELATGRGCLQLSSLSEGA